MSALSFAQNMLKSDKVQASLELAVKSLLAGTLREKEVYAQEKCVLSFCELIRNVEQTCLYSRGIHPVQIKKQGYGVNQKDYIQQSEEVERILEGEIQRQLRHFREFL